MSSRHRINVLVVDDLDENLLALEALLRRDDRTVLRARSGAEALEILLAEDVALALLDVQMPEMNGFELAELMRGTERTKHVPIIFLTAGSHDAQRVFRGYEVGAVDFLFKPLDPILLGHKVETFSNLHRQRLDLAESLRLNEMFMAAVSHDLRTPLSALVAGTSMLERLTTDPVAQRTLRVMRSSADRMTDMLSQLHDLTRARLGSGLTIEPRVTDVRALVDGVAEELRSAWRDRDIDIEYHGVAPLEGVWDEPRLGQVVANLVGNALRHGRDACPVRVRVELTASSLLVAVHNEGAISAEVFQDVFEPFRQGRGPRSRDGLGLGLYIVRELVTAHGGTVDVRSAEETGTTFSVCMPRHCAAS